MVQEEGEDTAAVAQQFVEEGIEENTAAVGSSDEREELRAEEPAKQSWHDFPFPEVSAWRQTSVPLLSNVGPQVIRWVRCCTGMIALIPRTYMIPPYRSRRSPHSMQCKAYARWRCPSPQPLRKRALGYTVSSAPLVKRLTAILFKEEN